MNLFFIFAGRQYYPSGGIGDLVETFPTLADALIYDMSNVFDEDWAYIAEYDGKEFNKLYWHGYGHENETYWVKIEAIES